MKKRGFVAIQPPHPCADQLVLLRREVSSSKAAPCVLSDCLVSICDWIQNNDLSMQRSCATCQQPFVDEMVRFRCSTCEYDEIFDQCEGCRRAGKGHDNTHAFTCYMCSYAMWYQIAGVKFEIRNKPREQQVITVQSVKVDSLDEAGFYEICLMLLPGLRNEPKYHFGFRQMLDLLYQRLSDPNLTIASNFLLRTLEALMDGYHCEDIMQTRSALICLPPQAFNILGHCFLKRIHRLDSCVLSASMLVRCCSVPLEIVIRSHTALVDETSSLLESVSGALTSLRYLGICGDFARLLDTEVHSLATLCNRLIGDEKLTFGKETCLEDVICILLHLMPVTGEVSEVGNFLRNQVLCKIDSVSLALEIAALSIDIRKLIVVQRPELLATLISAVKILATNKTSEDLQVVSSDHALVLVINSIIEILVEMQTQYAHCIVHEALLDMSEVVVTRFVQVQTVQVPLEVSPNIKDSKPRKVSIDSDEIPSPEPISRHAQVMRGSRNQMVMSPPPPDKSDKWLANASNKSSNRVSSTTGSNFLVSQLAAQDTENYQKSEGTRATTASQTRAPLSELLRAKNTNAGEGRHKQQVLKTGQNHKVAFAVPSPDAEAANHEAFLNEFLQTLERRVDSSPCGERKRYSELMTLILSRSGFLCVNHEVCHDQLIRSILAVVDLVSNPCAKEKVPQSKKSSQPIIKPFRVSQELVFRPVLREAASSTPRSRKVFLISHVGASVQCQDIERIERTLSARLGFTVLSSCRGSLNSSPLTKNAGLSTRMCVLLSARWRAEIETCDVMLTVVSSENKLRLAFASREAALLDRKQGTRFANVMLDATVDVSSADSNFLSEVPRKTIQHSDVKENDDEILNAKLRQILC